MSLKPNLTHQFYDDDDYFPHKVFLKRPTFCFILLNDLQILFSHQFLYIGFFIYHLYMNQIRLNFSVLHGCSLTKDQMLRPYSFKGTFHSRAFAWFFSNWDDKVTHWSHQDPTSFLIVLLNHLALVVICFHGIKCNERFVLVYFTFSLKSIN